MRLIRQEDLIPFLGTVRFHEKNKDMILAYIAIMNDILLEIVMNSTIFSGERIHLNQMVARGGKNIFNMFMFLVKNSLLQFHNLKSAYGTVSINHGSPTDSYTHRVIVMQNFIDDCINYIALNPGTVNANSAPTYASQVGKNVQMANDGSRGFTPSPAQGFPTGNKFGEDMGDENYGPIMEVDDVSTNSAMMSQIDTSRGLGHIQPVNFGV